MKGDSWGSPSALDAVLAALGGFSLAGLTVGQLTLKLAPQVQGNLGSSAYLLLFFGALYAAAGLVLGLAGAVVLGAARALRLRPGVQRFLGVAVVAGLGLGPLLYLLLLPDIGLAGNLLRNVVYGRMAVRLLAVVIGAALLILVGYGVRAAVRAVAAVSGRRGRAVLGAAWAVVAVSILVWGLAGRSVKRAEPAAVASLPVRPADSPAPTPVVLLCIDGADPDDMILPMVERGELPAFARLMREGTWGTLASIPPGRSHVIWTTIVTGKTPEEHGIRNFTTFRVPGLQRTIDELPLHTGLNRVLLALADRFPRLLPQLHAPYTSNMRNADALWNIVSRYHPVGVYQWLVTWPAEEVDGFYVAGGMRWANFVSGFREDAAKGLPEGAVYPADALDGLDLPSRPALTAADLAPYVESGEAAPKGDSRLRVLHEAIADPTAQVVAQLVGKYRPAFTAVDFYNVDSFEHLFTRDMNQRGPFARAVPQAYRLADAKLAELMDAVGEDVNWLIISDHGYDFALNHHIEAPPGIFMARGPAFAAGRRVDGLSVYDIAPLVLRLLDLPLGEDMRGALSGTYAGVLSAEFAAAHPEVRIATWETGRDRETGVVASPLDEEMTEVLRSLGYIE